ncbi:tellurite resistance TerB family protein [Paraburkholderia sartisoli]|uniref:Tellurite resistance protein TerB n=1 Tax=Paraburkholderia sartisoli TaxID=83784 RepID=A0A1H4DZB9_9BURK|nr:TerB N-terminal domain-containing protein [Paraburkholderia sartisoli]SEA77858.1 Tellurite resistance protein TerB [Paraburkholderia sartisoli]
MTNPSGSHDDEPLVTVPVSGNDGPADAGSYRIKTPAGASTSSTRWIMPGETVDIDDLSIGRGFFYVGDFRRARPGPVDACVVDTGAPLAPEATDPAVDIGVLPPGYATLSGEERRTYLEWLASSRRKSDIHTRYLFLHLFGFERRVLIDGAAGKVSAAEYEEMTRELLRMLNLDADYSWQRHVRNLLDIIGLMAARTGKVYDQKPPNGSATGYQVPLNVRVAFGQAALDRHPVPAGWALAWVKLDPMMIRRAAVARCPDEFDRVFMRRYRERSQEGMLVPVNRTRLNVLPQPAFKALQNVPLPGFLLGLPDVAAVTGPRNRLQLLMNESADALGAFSRYLARNPDAYGSLEATLMLPPDVWPDATRDALAALASDVADTTMVTTFGTLFARFKVMGTLTRDRMASFNAALSQVGVALEPDVRLGARTPKPDDAVVLFAAPATSAPAHTDDAYVVATLMVDLAAAVATADGSASAAEIALIEREIDAWSHLEPLQQTRLKARNLVQLAQAASSAGLKKKLEPLPAAVKKAIACFLVQTANADGTVSREEVKLLEKIYRMLDLDPQRLYIDLHQGASAASGSPRGARAAGAAKPGRSASKDATPDARPAGAEFVLDTARIAALQHETARVSAILADVFVEEQPAVPLEASNAQASVEPEEPEEVAATPGALLGLDDAHSTFLRLLVSRPAWTRAELADAAADLELMLDGAIEQVNEASLDHWDEPLTDGDDPVEINQDLAQRLAA